MNWWDDCSAPHSPAIAPIGRAVEKMEGSPGLNRPPEWGKLLNNHRFQLIAIANYKRRSFQADQLPSLQIAQQPGHGFTR